MTPLESIKLLSDLSPADLEALRKVTRELSFKPGQPIFQQGDAGDGIYFVKEGLVQISAVVPHGDLRVRHRSCHRNGTDRYATFPPSAFALPPAQILLF